MHPATGRPQILLTLLVALAAHWWILDLPFRIEDVTQIPLAGGMVLGTPLSPRMFHATSLALHGITAVLVLIGLRRFLPGGAALGGALIFALHPAGSQALSCIDARADILITLCVLLCWLGCQRAKLRATELRWPAVARYRVLGLSMFLLPVAAVSLWRRLALGIWDFDFLTSDARPWPGAYPALAPLAVLLAGAGAALAKAGRTYRAARAILAAGGLAFAIMSLDALVQTARAAQVAGQWINAQVERVEAEARPLPPDGVVLVAGAGKGQGRTPVPGDQLAWRFQPPFRAATLDVRHFSSLADALSLAHGLRDVKPAVVILEEGELGLVRRAGPLPPIPAQLPALVRAGASAVFRPESEVPMRAIARIQVFLPPGIAGPFRVVVRAEGDEIHFLLDPASTGAATDPMVFLDLKPELALSPSLREVEIEGLDAAAETIPPPLLLGDSLRIRLAQPEEGAQWRPGERLRFEFRSPVKAEWYRIEFQLVLPGSPAQFMVYEIPGAALETLPSGLLSWPPQPSFWVEGSNPEFRLENIPALYDQLGRAAEISEVTLHWRASALSSDRRSSVASSEWRTFSYVPE